MQLDEATHARLRRLSYEQGRSIASLVRDSVDRYLGAKSAEPKLRLKAFLFVAAGGGGRRRRAAKISEQHDEAFAEAVESRWKGPRGKGRRRP